MFCLVAFMIKRLFTYIKHMLYLVLVAWMLGVSNIILEETRMVHETRATIEQQEEVPDTDLDEDEIYTL